MTTPLPNKLLVGPPQVEPYQFGLLSVAEIREEEGKWQIGGVEYDSDMCAQGGYVVGVCAHRPGDHDKHHPEGLNTVRGSNPFAVYARAECNAVGFHEAAEIARRRVGIVEPRVVEEFFSREVLGRNQNTYFPLGKRRSVPLKTALGVLEQHAGQHYGGSPTFHVPRWVWPHVPTQDTRDTGEAQRTKLNSKVAYGAAYLDDPFDPPRGGLIPAAPGMGGTYAGGTFWMFVSGQVRLWRAPTRVYEALEEKSNTRLALGERPYAVDWDCYLAAVLVRMDTGVEWTYADDSGRGGGGGGGS